MILWKNSEKLLWVLLIKTLRHMMWLLPLAGNLDQELRLLGIQYWYQFLL